MLCAVLDFEELMVEFVDLQYSEWMNGRLDTRRQSKGGQKIGEDLL